MMLVFSMYNDQFIRADMFKIVLAVVNVVLRRDMFLNRRLYLWFLGLNVINMVVLNISVEFFRYQTGGDSVFTFSEIDFGYFYIFFKDFLIQVLKQKLFDTEDEEGDGREGIKFGVLRLFRILMSLLDKFEIGRLMFRKLEIFCILLFCV